MISDMLSTDPLPLLAATLDLAEALLAAALLEEPSELELLLTLLESLEPELELLAALELELELLAELLLDAPPARVRSSAATSDQIICSSCNASASVS